MQSTQSTQSLPLGWTNVKQILLAKQSKDYSALNQIPLVQNTGGLTLLLRAIHEAEDPAQGLVASKPNRGMSPASHVSHGSRHNGSQFISTTLDPLFALYFGLPEKRRIVAIDASKVRGRIINFSSEESWRASGLAQNNIRAVNYAIASQEVLIEGYIPPDAIIAIVDTSSLTLTARRARTVKYRAWQKSLREDQREEIDALLQNLTRDAHSHQPAPAQAAPPPPPIAAPLPPAQSEIACSLQEKTKKFMATRNLSTPKLAKILKENGLGGSQSSLYRFLDGKNNCMVPVLTRFFATQLLE